MIVRVTLEEWKGYTEIMMLAVNMDLMMHDITEVLAGTGIDMLGEAAYNELIGVQKALGHVHKNILDELSERIAPSATEAEADAE